MANGTPYPPPRPCKQHIQRHAGAATIPPGRAPTASPPNPHGPAPETRSPATPAPPGPGAGARTGTGATTGGRGVAQGPTHRPDARKVCRRFAVGRGRRIRSAQWAGGALRPTDKNGPERRGGLHGLTISLPGQLSDDCCAPPPRPLANPNNNRTHMNSAREGRGVRGQRFAQRGGGEPPDGPCSTAHNFKKEQERGA